MLYKIKLDDNSFIIADENYKMTIFRHHKKKKITLKQYLDNSKFWKYHMKDLIDKKKIKRFFIVESLGDVTEEDIGIKVGSRIKLAKDIKKGDLILGVDGKPRKVNELHTGEDDMYDIEVNGHTYTVNGGHILALVDRETGEHLEMPVNVYMHMDDEFRSHYVMEVEDLS